MKLEGLLDERLTFAEIKSYLLPTELLLMDKMAKQHSIEIGGKLYEATLRALYRFKAVLRHYHKLYKELSPEYQGEFAHIFEPMAYLDTDSRRCFSSTCFFSSVRFFLYASKRLRISSSRRQAYLEMVFGFPIAPVEEFWGIVRHELAPCNLPHVFIRRLSGMIRDDLATKRDHAFIVKHHRKFLREMNTVKAHQEWWKHRVFKSAYESRR